MWPFKRSKDRLTTDALFARWFRVQVPEGFPSLDAFEGAITDEERERLPKTFEKLALDGVERIYQVRNYELQPERSGLAFLDELLDAEMRWKLTENQDQNHPRNLLRVVATEFGCIVGEIYLRAGKATWELRRAPNHWRSTLRLHAGGVYDPFRAIVAKLSDDRVSDALVAHFDAT